MASALQRHAARVAKNERTGCRFLRAVGGVCAGTVIGAAALVAATEPTPAGLVSRPPARVVPGSPTTRPPTTSTPSASQPTAGPSSDGSGGGNPMGEPTTTAPPTRPDQVGANDQPSAGPAEEPPPPTSVPPTSQPATTTTTMTATTAGPTTTEPPRNKAKGLPGADDIEICYTRVDGGILIQRPCQSGDHR